MNAISISYPLPGCYGRLLFFYLIRKWIPRGEVAVSGERSGSLVKQGAHGTCEIVHTRVNVSFAQCAKILRGFNVGVESRSS